MNLYLGRRITQWNEKLATYLSELKRFIVTSRQNKKLDCGSKIAEFLKESAKKYKIWKNDSFSLYLACLECWVTHGLKRQVLLPCLYYIIEVDFSGEAILLKTFEVVSSPNGNTIQCDRTIRIGFALPLPFPLTYYLPYFSLHHLWLNRICYVPLIHACQLGV